VEGDGKTMITAGRVKQASGTIHKPAEDIPASAGSRLLPTHKAPVLFCSGD
jgi:hypothetical protein